MTLSIFRKEVSVATGEVKEIEQHAYLTADGVRVIDATTPPGSGWERILRAEDMPVDQEAARAQFKAQRQAAVDAIKVTVDGLTFDGDERSQERMSRAITAMVDGEVTLWVLADNSPVRVTREQLRAALRAAGQRQTELWVAGNGN